MQLITSLCETYIDRKQFEIELTLYPEDALVHFSENEKQTMYRVFQELLTNIYKHAQATEVSISITQHIDFVIFIIEDNGKGFATTTEKGIGLKNIEERILALHGKILLDTTRNQGSTIILEIPTKKDER